MNLLETLKTYGNPLLGYPSQHVLDKMYELNKDLDSDLRMLLFNPVRSIKHPLAHEPTDTKNFYLPIVDQYVPYLQAMIANRYTKTTTVKQSVANMEKIGYIVSSQGQLNNIWNRAETKLRLKDKRKAEKVRADKQKAINEANGKQKSSSYTEKHQKQFAEARKIAHERARVKKAETELANSRRRLARTAAVSDDPKAAIADVNGKKAKRTAVAQAVKDNVKDIESQNKKVLYEPTPKQAEFHAAGEDIVLYGGAAGGGKSYAMLIDVLRYCQYEDYRGLLIRRTSPMLKELIGVSRTLYPKAFPGATYNKSENVWYFPSGATIQFGYLDRAEDLENYQGLPYAYIGFDEIQHQRSDEGFVFLKSRLRSANPNIDCYIRASANPGGAPWVKETFIDPAEPNTTFYEGGLSYRFIPARLEDNPHLDTPKEGQTLSPYRKMLMALPEVKRKQMLEGDWLVGDDAMFTFSPMVHVTDEMPPMHWSVVNSLDYGFKDPACSLWGCICPETGLLFVYQELECLHHVHANWAIAVKEAEGFLPQGVSRVIDHSVFNNTGHTGPGVREIIAKHGLVPKPADRNREAGWNQIHNRLLVDPNTGLTGIVIHSSCVLLIDQLASARRNEKKPDDIDEKRIKTKGRMHHWDMLDCLRYMCSSRPSHLTIAERNMQYKTSAKEDNRYQGYFS